MEVHALAFELILAAAKENGLLKGKTRPVKELSRTEFHGICRPLKVSPVEVSCVTLRIPLPAHLTQP